MDALLATILSNAIIATALALLVFVVGLRVRRPALLHGLWLVVLLKLVTPPVFTIAWEPSAPAAPAQVPILPRTLPDEAPTIRPVEPPSPPVPASPLPRESTPFPWRQMLLTLWIGGSAAWMLLVAVRLLRFRRLLKEARLAPEWVAEETRTLADRIGLSRVPPVSLLPGAISPMIFAFGSAARILLPQELWTSLSREAARSLLAHELAHLRRRDHWIRILELVVTGIYWWLPTLWWARRELRKAEEECCDAWVVWALPDQEEEYAEALVRVVGQSPIALPPVASGIGQFSELKRRISMVMEGSTPHRLSAGARSMLLGLALLVPLIPAWAQEKPESKEAARREEREKVIQALQERVVLHRSVFESLPADSPLRRERLITLRHAELDLEVAREDLQALSRPPATTTPPANPAPVVPPPTPVPAPQSADDHYRLAELYLGLGDYEGADLESREALRLDPGHRNARQLRQDFESVLNREAAKVLERLTAPLPNPQLSAMDPWGRTVRVREDGRSLECITREGKEEWQSTLSETPGEPIRRITVSQGKVRVLQGDRIWTLNLLSGKAESSKEIAPAPKAATVAAVGRTPDGQDLVDILKARVEIQLAKLREAELTAQQATRRVERIRVLVEKGLAGQSELIERQNEMELGQSQVAIRRAELKEIEVLLLQAESQLRKAAPTKPR